ncbi:MAG: SMP-30/gluconolactonase/LRE family protein [Chloroflexi bacterium]|nr:MAG: SMP-30/gluconolactonase/LRE family protein [Chloroflexota bacterium]TMF85340.1 MAG: SMP-30/gluconolactonase/LRE family protein [Chloroflexota bacterium]
MSGDSRPVELVADLRNVIGEGPVWLEDEQRLVWVDIKGHHVHWLDPKTGRLEQIDVSADVGAVAPTTSGALIAAAGNGFQALDQKSGRIKTLAVAEPDRPGNRMNDGKCDSRGRFWAGTMADDETPGAGGLYRLNLDYTVDRMLSDVTVSNGLDWTADDRLMYYIDSASHRVDVLDFESSAGTIANRRPLIQIDKSDGMPDGMTLDAEGGLWVALWGGWSVRRYRPDGSFDLEIKIPASKVSSCVFGGPDFSDLYITTAASGLSEKQLEKQPHAGGLFRCRPGHGGRPPYRFGG